MRVSIKRASIAFVAGVLFFASVQQTILTATADAAYKVTSGVTFNNPYGTKSQRMAILNKVYGAIDATKKGHVVRIVTYSIRDAQATKKLIAAHKRGVIVQVIVSDQLLKKADEKDDNDPAKPLVDLIKALGTKTVTNNSRSFVKVCKNSCASQYSESSVHSKIYMFSTAGSSKRVVMSASSNLSAGHTYAWNNMYTAVGNEILYDELVENFYEMVREPKDADLYRNIAVSKTMRLYTFPRNTDGLDDDMNYTMLEKVRCTGAASGYGVKGKTALDFAMFKWTSNRSAVAEKLRSLADSGCRVRVVTDKANFDTAILRILTAPKNGKASTITVKDGYKKQGKIERYVHHKYITINGYYVDPDYSDADNRRSKIVFTGSPNLSSTGLRHNNEVLLRLRSASVHKSFTSNFETIYNKHSKTFKYVDPN